MQPQVLHYANIAQEKCTSIVTCLRLIKYTNEHFRNAAVMADEYSEILH